MSYKLNPVSKNKDPMATIMAWEESMLLTSQVSNNIAPLSDKTFSSPENWTSYNQKLYPRFTPQNLPVPQNETDFHKFLYDRRSCRSFSTDSISLASLSEALQAAFKTEIAPEYHRSYPSAGARYPVELYVIALSVAGLDRGVYYLNALNQMLVKLTPDIVTSEFIKALGDQEISTAPMYFVFTSSPFRSACKYGLRAIRYCYMEVGAAAFSLDLALRHVGLSSVWIGGFDDAKICELLDLVTEIEGEYPVLIVASGVPS